VTSISAFQYSETDEFKVVEGTKNLLVLVVPLLLGVEPCVVFLSISSLSLVDQESRLIKVGRVLTKAKVRMKVPNPPLPLALPRPTI